MPAVFEVRTLVVLRSGTAPPELGPDDARALQLAHVAYLADLVERGLVAANGPLLDASDPTMRGLSVYTVGVEEARRLAEDDPAVRAGRLRVDVARWAVAADDVAFGRHPDGVGERRAFDEL